MTNKRAAKTKGANGSFRDLLFFMAHQKFSAAGWIIQQTEEPMLTENQLVQFEVFGFVVLRGGPYL